MMDAEGLAPFVEFNRRRAVERAWEEEARAKPGGWHKPGEGEGRRYWADGRVELAAGGTRGKTMHDCAAAGDAAAVERRLARGKVREKGREAVTIFTARTLLLLLLLLSFFSALCYVIFTNLSFFIARPPFQIFHITPSYTPPFVFFTAGALA